jgi:hypothetical protein
VIPKRTSLSLYIEHALADDEATAMNILQDRCYLISDEAITANDVPNSGVIIAWIEKHPHLFRFKKRV